MHLDTSEGEEEGPGSDDEIGVAGTPGKFTLIVFSVNESRLTSSVYYYHTHIIEIPKLYFCCFCSVQFPLARFLVLALVKQPPLLLHVSIYFFRF